MCQWAYTDWTGLNVYGRVWLSSRFLRCLCQDFTWTAAPVHRHLRVTSAAILCLFVSPVILCFSVSTCLPCNMPEFSVLLNVSFSASLHTYLSLNFNCLAQYLFVFMQTLFLTLHTVCPCYGCGSCLLGHPGVESLHPECVICIVYSLIGLFNAAWQRGQVRAGSGIYH